MIDTLEVNGHTSSEWAEANFTNRYLNNQKLSQNRAFAVLSEMFKTQQISKQEWLSGILKGSGNSFAHTATFDNGIEDKKHSRRVDIKIILRKSPV